MATDPRVLLDAAFAAYGDSPPPGYNSTGQTIINDEGLYVAVYRKVGADEYIVAFRGTEQTMADINTDVSKGWPQYKDSTKDIQRLIKGLLAKSDHLDITGHSLGGALAQFAIYDLVAQNQDKPISTSKYTLTTWNALGGEWALKKERDYKPGLLTGINATHYYRNDDLVSRLGRGHVGGECIELRDPRRRIAGVIEAHMKEALLSGLETGTGYVKPPAYLPISDSSQTTAAALIGGLQAMSNRDTLLEGLLLTEYGTLRSSITFNSQLAADLGFLLGTILIQERAAKIDQDLPPITALATSLAKDFPASNKYLFDVAQGVASFLQTQFQDGGAGEQFLSRLQELGSSLIHNLTQSVAQINPDQAALLGWIMMRVMVLGPVSPRVVEALPGLPNLLPFQYLITSGFKEAAGYSCPLVLDLDGDGIETVALAALDLHFDHDGNRYAERSGWVGPDDGLLVYDRNGDQTIDRGSELFGNQTRLANGSLAANGFEALKEFDSNGDGCIDRDDADWGRLQLWRDFNLNGEVETGELLSLAEAGVASLDLAYDSDNLLDGQGNQQRQLGSYRTSQGERRALVDVWFQVDAARSLDLDPIPIDPEIALLPNIAGMGHVASLHQAMQRDRTGQLRQLVEQWQQAGPEARASLIRPLIYRWTGVFDRSALARRSLDDFRSLAAMEALLGSRYRNGEGIQADSAGVVLGQTFEKLCGRVNNVLEAGELLGSVLSPELLNLDPESLGFHWDAMGVISALLRRYGNQPNDELLLRLGRAMRSLPTTGAELMASFRQLGTIGKQNPLGQRLWLLVMEGHIRSVDDFGLFMGSEVDELLEGGDGDDRLAAGPGHDVLFGKDQNDRLYGQAGDDVMDGGSGDDSLVGGDGRDILVGGLGDDVLKGEDGDDTLIGGPGNDVLSGESGHNLYCFSPGDGQDLIVEDGYQKNYSNILLDSTWQPSDVKIRRFQLDLIVDLGAGDSLTATNYFLFNDPNNSNNPIQSLQFADGRTWDRTELTARALQGGSGEDSLDGTLNSDIIHAGAGNDLVYGRGGNDQLFGDSGDDKLIGNEGDDDLDGGAGNDTLIGGAGNNSYRLSRGGGQDKVVNWDTIQPDTINRIICDADIRPSDLQVSRFTNTLDLTIIGTEDRLSLLSVFDGDNRNKRLNPVQELIFSDGNIWSMESMIAMSMLGTDEADNIWGLNSDDTLLGRAGDDYLWGVDGHDLLRSGTGNDRIYGGDGDDSIEGGPGIDYTNGGTGNNTYYFAKGDGQDVISYSMDTNPNRNNILEFAAGITPADVTARRHGWDRNLDITIKSSNDRIIVENFFYVDSGLFMLTPLQLARFQDGTTWNFQDLVDLGLSGTDTAEELVGTLGNDRISGAGGDDTITGGKGNDKLEGGLGNNIYRYALFDGNDVLTSYFDANTARQNILNFEQQIRSTDLKMTRVGNRLRLDILSSGESISVDDFFRDSNVQNSYNPLQVVRFSDGTSWSARTMASMVSNLISGTRTDNILKGGSGDEWLDGRAGNDQLLGMAGHDQLNGGLGQDTLLGGDGNDLLDGGDGVDTASYAGVMEAVVVDLGLSAPQATGAGLDTLVAVENLIGGSGGDHLLGNGAANQIDGGDGDDLIDGGTGNDTLIGGNHLGGDSLSYGMATAAVKVSLALTNAQNTGGAGSDLLSGFEHLIGSRFADKLSGNAADNRIEGGAGNDTMQGAGGADSLQGGDGADLFLYANIGDAGNGIGSRDLITDWSKGDRIDLSAIDARSDRGGNQAFTWIGSAPFSALGQLRYSSLGTVNGNGLLEGNCSGSLAAEFQLELSGAPSLSAAGITL